MLEKVYVDMNGPLKEVLMRIRRRAIEKTLVLENT